MWSFSSNSSYSLSFCCSALTQMLHGPEARSVCLSLSHTLTNTHSHWCSPATSKNVLPSPPLALPSPPLAELSRAWALRAGYNRSPLLLLIYWWHLQDVAPPYVVGRVGFLFLAFYDETQRRRSRSVLAAVRQGNWTAERWKRRRRAWMKRDETVNI